jgi:hypothetical protein
MRQTKPIGAAGGRDCGLEIADWGFEGVRCARFVWTEYQTNPIWPAESPAIDEAVRNQDRRGAQATDKYRQPVRTQRSGHASARSVSSGQSADWTLRNAERDAARRGLSALGAAYKIFDNKRLGDAGRAEMRIATGWQAGLRQRWLAREF